ncbi:hypothetical protein [Acrocarpospora corrugata]|uniref:hypothetical protein n=1 Tax=Acrocarpospora corrugata TaxID=35763 RepID=UPI0015817040|nr:hypothetical protein [Acrocarpospora corrugata]
MGDTIPAAPAYGDLVGVRDVEWLPVHLLLADDNGLVDARRDRMTRIDRPDQFALALIPPGE